MAAQHFIARVDIGTSPGAEGGDGRSLPSNSWQSSKGPRVGGMAMMAMMAQNLHQTHQTKATELFRTKKCMMKNDENPKGAFTDYNDSMSSSETKV